jgi:hypothetical protein
MKGYGKRVYHRRFGLHPIYWTRIPILGGGEGRLFVLKFVFDRRHATPAITIMATADGALSCREAVSATVPIGAAINHHGEDPSIRHAPHRPSPS